MNNHETNPSPNKRQCKDTQKYLQKQKVFEGFLKEPQSMKMLAVKLKIDRANICWFCKEFRKNEQLGIAKRGICLITKQMVNYYTTNPELFPKSNQIKLF